MVSPLSLPPKDAIAFFRSKGMRKGFDYRDVWQQEHAQAFTVAKAMQVDILEDICQALDDALVEGQIFEHFKKQLTPILQAKGWWGRKEMVDPETEKAKIVQLGSPRRLATIYEVNLRSAYSHGNWQRIQASKRAFPYLMYVGILDSHIRPQHRAWHGTCLPVDDPWWDTHYPACGYRCRCGTRSLTRSQVEREGIDLKAPVPHFPVKPVVNGRTGEVTMVEEGIDPAFNFNIGKAPLRPITARPAQVERDRPVKDIETTTKPFFEAAGIDPKAGRIVKDKQGWPLAINDQLFIDSNGKPALPSADITGLPLVAQALKSPDKAEWLWSSAIHQASDAAAIETVLAALPGDGRAVGRLTALEPWLVKQIGASDHRLRATDVRHAFIEHGDLAKETARGQVPIDRTDILALPDIVRFPDVAVFGMKDHRGQMAVTFIKQRMTDTIVYTATISPGKRQLAFKTIWKRPAGTDAKVLANSLSQHARNDGGDTPQIVDMAGKIKPPKDALVRRYTKRVDKSEVTVDFSTGTWTYDVRSLSGD